MENQMLPDINKTFAQAMKDDPQLAAHLTEMCKVATCGEWGKAQPAVIELTEALETPLRQALLVGDTVRDIFQPWTFTPGQQSRIPLDFYTPGQEAEHIAYTVPKAGSIATKQVEGDYVIVPTYWIANSISAPNVYVRDANWNVLARMMQVLQAGMTKKINDDGWHLILGAGVDRNILVFDSDAPAGLFTKRLVSLLKVVAKRNGGGNSSSIDHGDITDIYMSPEGFEDIRNWNIDQLSDIDRTRVFNMAGGTLSDIFGTKLHELYELGESQEYQLYYTDQLAASLGSDVELVVGLNKNKNNFVMPVIEEASLIPDQRLFYERLVGWLTYMELGFACLDNRGVLLGSF
jgi:hypothetical protein